MKLSELKYDPVGNFWYDDEGLNVGPLWMQDKAIQLEAENERLRERSEFLGYLEQAGVDNWSGYSYAYEIKEEVEALKGDDDD